MQRRNEIITVFTGDRTTDVNLTHVSAFIEDDKVYLSLKYLVEDSKEVISVDIPKAELPLSTHKTIITQGVSETGYFGEPTKQDTWITMDGNTLRLRPDKTDLKWTLRVIKKKTRKMTVSEIEKALGYSVEIVSE